MSIVNKRYPLSTADGKYIPLDIVRPISFIRSAIINTTGTTSRQIPSAVEMVKVRSSVEALIGFYSVATVIGAIANDTTLADTIYLPANIDVIISPPIDKYWYSVISESAGGFVYVQCLETWNALSLQSQLTRR